MDKQSFDPEEMLKPDNMLKLYSMGAFPMAEDTDDASVNWYMPEIRTIIPLDGFNTPRSLRKHMEKTEYEIAYDKKVMSVIAHCSHRKETWISKRLIEAYENLYKLGHIHTVEVYMDGKIAGGLYGVTFGGAFFGESMFSHKPQASKIALVHLVKKLRERGFVLLDVQFMTEHLRMFGAVEITFEEYQFLLFQAHQKNPKF